MNCADIKAFLSEGRVKLLFYSVLLGLLFTVLFSGKSSAELQTIAVSPSEEFIAYHEHGGEKLLCFYSDASMAFEFTIPSDISNGGNCSLWFDDDSLNALFYRTKKIVHLSMDGTVQNIADYTAEGYPPEFLDFSTEGRQRIFNGDTINVIYDKGSFLGYWFFGAERYLKIIPQSGEPSVIWTGTTKNSLGNGSV